MVFYSNQRITLHHHFHLLQLIIDPSPSQDPDQKLLEKNDQLALAQGTQGVVVVVVVGVDIL